MERIVVDLDDLGDAVAPWALPLLDRLYHESAGRFRATLFTIPARTGPDTLAAAASRPWLELAVHGWQHQGPECANWMQARATQVLEECARLGYARVFKAPHWIASPQVYVALQQASWIVADHPRNALTIPPGLRRYVLAPNHAIGVPHNVLPVVQAHGHFTSEGVDNGLRENLGAFRALAQWNLPYAWVSEVAI